MTSRDQQPSPRSAQCPPVSVRAIFKGLELAPDRSVATWQRLPLAFSASSMARFARQTTTCSPKLTALRGLPVPRHQLPGLAKLLLAASWTGLMSVSELGNSIRRTMMNFRTTGRPLALYSLVPALMSLVLAAGLYLLGGPATSRGSPSGKRRLH